jgi:hypothetical protein
MPSYDADPFKYLRSRALGTMQRRGGGAFSPPPEGYAYVYYADPDTGRNLIVTHTADGITRPVIARIPS